MKPPEKSLEVSPDLLVVLRWAVQAGALLSIGTRGGLQLRSPEPPPQVVSEALSMVAYDLATRLRATGAPSPFFALMAVWFAAELLAASDEDLAAADERIAWREHEGQPRTVAELLGLAELVVRADPNSVPIAA